MGIYCFRKGYGLRRCVSCAKEASFPSEKEGDWRSWCWGHSALTQALLRSSKSNEKILTKITVSKYFPTNGSNYKMMDQEALCVLLETSVGHLKPNASLGSLL